jgi:glycosyltransferase involved in cell wall biosynthesis
MSLKIKVAIDSGPLKSGDSIRGIGVYTRELLKALKMDGVDVSKEDLGKYDVVHFTRFNPFFVSVPFVKPKNTKFVLTIYDLIPLIYPSHYPPGVKGKLRFLINKYLINKNVDAIITISETSKKDICRFLSVDPKKVFVTYLAPRSIFKKMEIGNWKLEIAKRYNLPEHFALYVGDVNYNKNIPWLIEKAKEKNLPLVIVGKQAKEIEDLDLDHPELSHLTGVNFSGVIRLGFVDDADLVKIYNLATVYIQPSLYEGFGLPAVEAVACGTPIIFFKSQALVEILGDGKKLLRSYSWEKTARETFKVYKHV